VTPPLRRDALQCTSAARLEWRLPKSAVSLAAIIPQSFGLAGKKNLRGRNIQIALPGRNAVELSEAPGASNTPTPLTIATLARRAETMADGSQYPDSAPARNPEQSATRLTPGSQPWAAAVVHDLRSGFGVEDIALRLHCRVDAVRDKVATWRRMGLIPELYAQARKGWRR
jgi:hypothetical protein